LPSGKNAAFSDPIYRGAESRKPPVHNDEITLRHDRSWLILQRWRKALNQIKQSITTGSDVGAMLNVFR
jgi:hypothetical protein